MEKYPMQMPATFFLQPSLNAISLDHQQQLRYPVRGLPAIHVRGITPTFPNSGPVYRVLSAEQNPVRKNTQLI
jgi:hypothetical protein